MDDITGVAKATKYLTRFIQAGIGEWYKPIGMKREADAEAYAIAKITEAKAKAIGTLSNAHRNNMDVPVAYDDGAISINPDSPRDMVERTQARLFSQEITKQSNIESIIELTQVELVHTPEVPDEPVDERWARRFFESAAEMSNEETQKLWAKILAGEIKKKGSFSLRTLDVMKNLSQEEAELFQWIVQYLIFDTDTCFMIINQRLEESFEIHFAKLMKLDDCGLFSSLHKQIELSHSKNDYLLFTNNFAFTLTYLKNYNSLILDVFNLTSTGYEILSLISGDSNRNYVKELMKSINMYKEGVIMSMYERKEHLDWADYANEKNLLEED